MSIPKRDPAWKRLDFWLQAATVACILGILNIFVWCYFGSVTSAVAESNVLVEPKLPATVSPASSDEENITNADTKTETITMADLRVDLLEYYNTLITFLIALLGASALIGYLHLHRMSKEESEEKAYEAVSAYFERESTQNNLRDSVDELLYEHIPDNEMFFKRLERLEDAVESMRQGFPPIDTLEYDAQEDAE
jgi:hypothetical protein